MGGPSVTIPREHPWGQRCHGATGVNLATGDVRGEGGAWKAASVWGWQKKKKIATVPKQVFTCEPSPGDAGAGLGGDKFGCSAVFQVRTGAVGRGRPLERGLGQAAPAPVSFYLPRSPSTAFSSSDQMRGQRQPQNPPPQGSLTENMEVWGFFPFKSGQWLDDAGTSHPKKNFKRD